MLSKYHTFEKKFREWKKRGPNHHGNSRSRSVRVDTNSNCEIDGKMETRIQFYLNVVFLLQKTYTHQFTKTLDKFTIF